MAVAAASEVFEQQMPARLAAKPDLAGKINAVYKFIVTGDGGGNWMVDLKQPGGKISQGDGEANCTSRLRLRTSSISSTVRRTRRWRS